MLALGLASSPSVQHEQIKPGELPEALIERDGLCVLSRGAARTVITVYRAVSGRPDAAPGMVGAIQTFGQLIHQSIFTRISTRW